ncbi:MAG: hypothetical protein RBT11_14905 [Desulfobacterales bacterium]|nr:hypothetical protein [Desulfobacterales bacterium]
MRLASSHSTWGDPEVLACGAWDGPPKLIHANEAVYDEETAGYTERKCYEARLKS